MAFDAAIALRMITNGRLRNAQSCEYRDLRGALAVTSDAPIPDLNCLNAFTTNERNIESLLDVGFALLRAFDREPAAEVTPLDRPTSLVKHLQRRRMAITGRRTWMAFRGDPAAIPANAEVEVRVAEPDDVRTFANLHGGSEAWVRRMSLSSTMAGMLDPANTYYLAYLEDQPVATLHLLRDGATAGIYAVGTIKTHRRKGVSSTLIARAVTDAQSVGCDLICLSSEANGYAQTLYTKLGFHPAFESQMWEPADRA
jgi:GNAT superfamily N-acetyltransferase